MFPQKQNQPLVKAAIVQLNY
ncbi:hypothetical protein CY0110_17202 [Crocosphaera chwakensis CCY0110]|uniref:Uncharacterized protein n=1 Tax=Crocosphaera chwakensis CCY0110 TaxID=391612 RepID=A3IIC2_9CHRO|nr:hypothetical protein CY0110_17202 [Crocosphaera chwakensis CCY0110]